jgi:acylphosphatase
MALLTRRLFIHGRVQGVGFRWSLNAQANALGLAGWVRNRHDGSVEALVRGQPDAVDALTAWAWQGPPAARVDRVIVRDEPDQDTPEVHGGFRQRPTF